MRTEQPTAEQLAALQLYAQQHGRTWRHQLWLEWQDGTDSGELRQVRNSFGPSWLLRFKLPKAIA